MGTILVCKRLSLTLAARKGLDLPCIALFKMACITYTSLMMQEIPHGSRGWSNLRKFRLFKLLRMRPGILAPTPRAEAMRCGGTNLPARQITRLASSSCNGATVELATDTIVVDQFCLRWSATRSCKKRYTTKRSRAPTNWHVSIHSSNFYGALLFFNLAPRSSPRVIPSAFKPAVRVLACFEPLFVRPSLIWILFFRLLAVFPG